MAKTHASLLKRWTEAHGEEVAAQKLEAMRAYQRGASKKFYDSHKERVLGWVRKYQETATEVLALCQTNKDITRWTKQEQKAGRQRPLFCEICHEPESTGRAIAFDHCHAQGHFRGWLCGRCNQTLGRCKDDPELLIKMAAYLELDRLKHPPKD